MKKFSTQLKLLSLGLILAGSLGLTISSSKVNLVGIANAAPTPDPNCPGVTSNAPLKKSEAYGFYATGADDAAGANATTTIVGDMETDPNGCPEEGFFTIDDNGFVCTGTLTSVLTVNSSPPKTGTMAWTSSCFTVPISVAWANGAGANPNTMYFSSNSTASALVLAGKLEDNAGSDGPVLTGTGGAPSVAIATGKKHRH